MFRRQKSEWAKPKLANRRSTSLNPAFVKKLSGGVSQFADKDVASVVSHK
jgi:hypothetical protein